MTTGIQAAAGKSINTPLPIDWLGRPDAPSIPADRAIASLLTATEVSRLQGQIAYDLSGWDYSKVGENNRLGRYQFKTTTLENYGILAVGSNQHYGIDCVNYQSSWQQTTQRKNTSSYSNYLCNITSLAEFLTTAVAQEHLADQIIYDLCNDLQANQSIVSTDSADIVAGMIYVGWTLGVGKQPSYGLAYGTGAYAWRYHNVGQGADSFNSGRYSITVLSQ